MLIATLAFTAIGFTSIGCTAIGRTPLGDAAPRNHSLNVGRHAKFASRVRLSTAADSAPFSQGTSADESTVETVAFVPPLPLPSASATQPSSTANGQQRSLTLEEAVTRSLQRNPDIVVTRYGPRIASQRMVLADAIFDPTIAFGGQWSEDTSQIVNATNGPGVGVASQTVQQFAAPSGLSDHLSFAKRFRNGGDIRAGLASTYRRTSPDGGFLAFNPAIESRINFEYTLPLLRNAGRDQATIEVRLAGEATRNAQLRLAQVAQEVVARTVTAYWSYLQAVSGVRSANDAVKEAEGMLSQEREKLELGASTDSDVSEAQAQLEAFRITQTIAEENARLAAAELSLVTGGTIAHDDDFGTDQQPESTPPPPDWRPYLPDALSLRPEAKIQRSLIRTAELQRRSARNGLLPELNAYAGWGVSGAGDDVDESWRTLGSADFQNWWIGLRFQQAFGNRAARAQYAETWLSARQARAELRRTEQEIANELKTAHQRLISSWKIVSLSQSRLEAARTVLDARTEMRELGALSIQDYLIALENWRQADVAARTALFEYNIRLVAWRQARGRILQSLQITLGN